MESASLEVLKQSQLQAAEPKRGVTYRQHSEAAHCCSGSVPEQAVL